jgi:hypothetical protein
VAPKSQRPKKADSIRVEPSPGPPWLRRILVALGALYVAAVFCEAAGMQLHSLVYRPLLYFCQIAKLFPGASRFVFEHRAQGTACNGREVEIDVRPFFPIHADDKESRFDRAIFFYSTDRPTMQALEGYILREYNKSEPEKIAGVTLTRVQIPIPSPGSDFARFERKPLSDYPESQRQVFYHTPKRVIDERCKKGDL